MSQSDVARPILVLHAPPDEAFARGYLAPALGGGAGGVGGVRVMAAPELAALSTSELQQLIAGSRAVIAVITPAFAGDPWAKLGEELAREARLAGGPDIVPLVLEELELRAWKGLALLDLRRRKDWEAGMDRLRRQLARPVVAGARPACPYPGMRPFRDDEAARFHGRSAEIEEVLGRLSSGERELYVIGPSGCGKSSLITAGVLPRLAGAEPIVVRTLRPGSAPVRRLAEALEADGEDVAAGLAKLLERASGEPAGEDAREGIDRNLGARLVVFVDQLEELFTQAAPDQRARFAAALKVVRAEPRCVVLLALRADFYAELLESELWRDGGKRHVDLLPLRGAALRAAIEQPARAVEVYLEGELIERLLRDAAGEPGVLPLLQETLVQLWDRMRERLLTLADYEGLGTEERSGLAVAISTRADRCLREMTGSQETIARRTLLRLVSFGEGRPNTRRRQPRSALGAGEPAEELAAVLGKLQEARLITLDGDERTGEVRVDLCHEALIGAWPSFASWVEARRADEQRRRQIQASAEEWQARGRGASGLLDEGELATAEAWRRTDAARELGETPEVTALIDASRRAQGAARRRRRRLLVLGIGAGLGVIAALTVASVVSVRQASIAARALEEQRREAGRQLADVGRQLVVDGHLQRAVPYLVAARERGVDDPALRMLFRTATRMSVLLPLPHDGTVTSVGYSADGARIVTTSLDRTARVWDARTGAELARLPHPRPVLRAMFRPDGARVLTIAWDHTVRIWDPASSAPPAIELRHDGHINAARFSADGSLVVTAGDDRTARIWRAATGEQLARLEHADRVMTAELSRDGSRLVTTLASASDGRGTAELWDAATGRRIASLEAYALVLSARFSADGARVLTAGGDGTARLWDAATGAPLTEPLVREGHLLDAIYSPDGARFATASREGRVRFWSAADGRPLPPVLEHPGPVSSIAYSPDGARLVTLSVDKVVRVWDAIGKAASAATLELEAGANDVAFSPDGTRLATSSADGLARVWDVTPAGPRREPSRSRLAGGTYSPDGSRIATIQGDGLLQIRSASGALEVQWNARHEPRLGLTLFTKGAVFHSDGRRIATVSPMHHAQIWDIASRRMLVASTAPEPLPEHADAVFAFSPDGSRFAISSDDRTVQLWDTDAGRAAGAPLAHAAEVTSVRFGPDGRRVLTACLDGAARLWDAASGQPLGAPLRVPGEGALALAVFSPDGTRIATAARDGGVRLWDARTGQPVGPRLAHAASVIAAAFSPDGARLLTGAADLSARIWDAAAAKLLVPPLEHGGWVNDVAFSADGARVVTVTHRDARVWDAATGRPLTAPLVHPELLRGARFHPGGASLLTVASDGIRIWDVGLDARSLEEWRRVAARVPFPQISHVLGVSPAP